MTTRKSQYSSSANTLKKDEEVEMIPIAYLTPFCHNREMISIYTYTDNRIGLFTQFKCQVCNHVESRHVAVPNRKGTKLDNNSNQNY